MQLNKGQSCQNQTHFLTTLSLVSFLFYIYNSHVLISIHGGKQLMKKILTKLFILFSLLITVTSNVTPLILDNTDITNNIEEYSDIPLDNGFRK